VGDQDLDFVANGALAPSDIPFDEECLKQIQNSFPKFQEAANGKYIPSIFRRGLIKRLVKKNS